MSLKDFEIKEKLGEFRFLFLVTNLGTGTYSSVYKVRKIKDGEFYALKRVKIDNLKEKDKMNALNEVRILASIRHPNIVTYKESFLDEQSNSLWYPRLPPTHVTTI